MVTKKSDTVDDWYVLLLSPLLVPIINDVTCTAPRSALQVDRAR
jgi:hypothetical protein